METINLNQGKTVINDQTTSLTHSEKEFLGSTAASILQRSNPNIHTKVEFMITSRQAYQAIVDACECLPTLDQQKLALAEVTSSVETLYEISRSAIRFISNI